MRKLRNRFPRYKDPVIGASVVVANNFKAWLKKRGLEHGVRATRFGKRVER